MTSAATIPLEELIARCPKQPRVELVEKFVDFSSKYGLGYKLSNGQYGVLFNDSTKIITHTNLFHFDYIERPKSGDLQAQETVSHYDFFDYPSAINKKVILL